MSKIVSFCGTDCYDLVHYLARTAQSLGAEVLVIDRSRNEAMAVTVPVPLGEDIMDYRGVDFTRAHIDLNSYNYDYVFIYHGTNAIELSDMVEEVYLVTDCQKHHIDELKRFVLPEGRYRSLIIRNFVNNKNYSRYACTSLQCFDIEPGTVVELPFSNRDLSYMLSVQYDGVYTFSGLSVETKEFIVNFFSVDYPEKTVKKAFNLAAKGKGEHV